MKKCLYSMCLTLLLFVGYLGNAQCISGTTDPTGSSYNNLPDNYLAGNQILNACSGNLQSLSFYSFSAPNPTAQLRFSIYSDFNNGPSQLLAQTVMGSLLSGWNTLAIQTNLQITPGNYWVMVNSTNTNNNNGIAELGGGNIFYTTPVDINNLPAIVNGSSSSSGPSRHFVSYMTVGLSNAQCISGTINPMGSSYNGLPDNYLAGNQIFNACSGNLQSLSFYSFSAPNPAAQLRFSLYSDVNNVPSQLLGQTVIGSLLSGWNTLAIQGNLSVTPGNYWVMVTSSNTNHNGIAELGGGNILYTSPADINNLPAIIQSPTPSPSHHFVSHMTVGSGNFGAISYTGSPFCQTGVKSVTRASGTPSGGTYSSTTGLSINSINGVIIPAASTPGDYTVVYTYPGGSTTTPVTILPLPKASIGTAAPVCFSASTQTISVPYTITGGSPARYDLTVNATSPMPGFFEVVGGALNGSTINVSVPANTAGGTYYFTLYLKSAQGCSSGKYVFGVTVIGATTTISYPGSPFCQTGNGLVTRIGASGGTYSSTAGLSINATTGAILPASSTPGTYSVTYSVGACSLSTTASVSIIATPRLSVGNVVAPVCVGISGATAFVPYAVTAGSPVSYDISVGSINPMPGYLAVTNAPLQHSVAIPPGTTAGTYYFNLYVKTAEGCSSGKYVFGVKISGPCPVASPVFSRTAPVKNIFTEEGAVTIAPNPVHRMLNIHSATQGSMSVRITNAEGRMLLPSARFSSSYSFDMSGYAAGIYMVEVVDEKTGEIVRKKVVKE